MRKRIVYTIEYGYIDNNPIDDARVMTNETSYLSKRKYQSALKQILKSMANNTSKNGYYIECYFDKQVLNEQNIQDIKEFESFDCPNKENLIQEFVCKNY